MTEFTAHFRLPVPDFNQEPWHDQFRDLCVAIDNMAHEALLANAQSWENSHSYAIGDIVLDEDNGLLYVCAIAHTSPPFPTTFLTFRTANPGHWNSIIQIPQFRGTWTTATTYVPNDFVVDNSRYAVCLVAHVSTVFNTDLGAGRWAVLIDLTTVNVGINGLTEASIAAAATVDLGIVNTSQVLVSGSGANITSFGTSAEKFKILRFDGVNTITGGANITMRTEGTRNTVAGDIMFVRSNNVGQWRELYYWTAASEGDQGSVRLATNALALAGADDLTAMTPLKSKQARDASFNTYFPAGCKILFQQTTPPVGWTKDVTHNDKALRVVSGAVGSGGSSPFSTVFGKTGTDNTTLTTANIPSHAHQAFIRDPTHFHVILSSGGTTNNPGGTVVTGANAGANQNTTEAKLTGVHVNSVNGGGAGTDDATAATGSGGAHNHPMDIRVQFVDTVIATRI